MDNKTAYPPSEFLRDFQEWQAAQNREPDIFRRAAILFSRRYHPDLKAYIYRLNRFKCIIRVIHQTLPQLVQDKIALRGSKEMDYIPQALLLALHDWYCRLDESAMATMPDPKWEDVFETFDQLWKEEGS